MKKRMISLILASTLLGAAGCGATETPVPEAVQEEPLEELTGAETEVSVEAAGAEDQVQEAVPDNEAAEVPETDGADYVTTGGTPWIDSDLMENLSADMETSPRDDFHLYANKEWLLNNEIPDGYDNWSHYNEREFEVTRQSIDLLTDESLDGHDAELIQAYNRLVLDWDARNGKGYTELQGLYEKVIAAKSIEDITRLLTDEESYFWLYNFMSFAVSPGLNDPDTYIVNITTPGLLLADSAEYSERSELGDMIYSAFGDMFTYMAGRMGMSEEDARKCYDRAIALEGRLAERIYTTEESNRDDYLTKINNEMTYDEVKSLAKNYPLDRILTLWGLKYDGIYLVTRPDYFEVLDEIYADDNLEDIKDLLIVNYMLGNRSMLDRETYDKTTELNSRYFGLGGALPDEEMAYTRVADMLSVSMVKVYISKYGSGEDRRKMEELCRQVIDTYREILSENEWASEETREYALKKLDNITIRAAYPDKLRDTSGLDFSGCSLIEATQMISKDDFDYMKGMLGRKKDDEMWADNVDLLSCNAYYSYDDNSITMCIGMMGEPFYSDDMSTEELYASIGAFWVGHEISHAFDNTGAQFDAEGLFRDWWTAKDKEEFSRRTGAVDKYLDGIVAFADKHFTGTNIDTEMIADMTGLQCALRMASKVDGFDYDRFFVKYAQLNGRLALYSRELSALSQDDHPLDYSRTNVPVQQFEEFYETYGVKEGDNMYLAPEDRILIW